MIQKILKGLVTVLIMTAFVVGSVGEARAQKARDRAPKVIELEEMVIEGKVAKPNVMYVLGKKEHVYASLRLDHSFLDRIINTVKANPF